jgi:hypothetical protein
MTYFFRIFIFIPLLCGTMLHAQGPVASDSSLYIHELMQVQPNAVRIARNPVDHALYYITYNGNIYKIIQSGTVYDDTLIASAMQHHINYLQGMIFKDSMLYIVGNQTIPNVSGHGMLMAGTFLPGGSWSWDTLMYTAEYPNTATLFDHSFSSICLSSNKDSIYIGSGSRTDHGEIQTKNGLFPGAREVALTSKIYKIALNGSVPVFLPNDSAVLDSSNYVFCRGVRNSFDLILAPNGDLLGSENSGDRDDPEELNWLQQDHHYGFPWRMGGNATGMQFAGYDSSADLLINHNCAAWTNHYFYNDPSYPSANGIVFTEPVKNYGPDADKFRDPLTGAVHDAGNDGIYITSFTPHRAPLGLVFDYNGALSFPYNRSAFILGYTAGTADTTGTLPNGSIGPFSDTGQDLLQLALFKDTATQEYSMNCYRVISDFNNPVDAYLEDTVLYILESHYQNNPVAAKLYSVHFNRAADVNILPADTVVCGGSSLILESPLKGKYNYQWSTGETTKEITVTPGNDTAVWIKVDNGLFSLYDTIYIHTDAPPPIPSAILITGGSSKVCPGESRRFVTHNGADGIFQWDVPPGAVINNGQGTNSIEVSFNAAFVSSGDISVMKTNSCGFSPLRTITITPYNDPDGGAINGTAFGLCNTLSEVFSVDNIPGCNYSWTVPLNAGISSGQGTSSITVDFPAGFFDGGITVTTSNGCGTGSLRKLRVHSVSTAPEEIAGSKTVCANTPYIYTIDQQPSATSYTWTGPQGCIITGNAVSATTVLTTSATTVEIVYPSIPLKAGLSVRANNDCGSRLACTIRLFPCLSRMETSDFHVSILNEEIEFINAGSCIYIYNMLGNLIRFIPAEKGKSEFRFQKDELAPGIYIARSESSSVRMVISR